MRRRAFLAQLAAAACAAAGAPPARAADAWHSAYREAAVSRPWLLGYRSIERAEYAAEVAIEGRWPRSLRGVFYRNGPAQHEVGGYRYRHWFDGDGLVQRFAVGEGRLRHRARVVATAKRAREAALGRAGLPTFGSLPPDSVGVASADDLNPANISVLWHHDRLFALWEAGSPHGIDAGDLRTLGRHHFSPESRGVPFSAHPRVEPDGTLWNFGYASGSGRIALWHLDARGRVVKLRALDVGQTGMPHDFIITERYLVLLLAPLHRDPEAPPDAGFLGLHRWHPERPTRVLVVDKGDFSLVRELELPAQWIFHFGNGFDDGNGIIRFDAARHDDPHVMQRTLRDVMRGQWTPSRHARWFDYTLEVEAGRATEALALEPGLGVEFPSVPQRETGRSHGRLVLLTGDGNGPSAPGDLRQVSCWHRRGERLDSYRYPPTHLVEEHLLVPGPGGNRARGGWILGTALDCARGVSELNVFDADDLAGGPVAHARLPYALPLGLHGTFVAEAG